MCVCAGSEREREWGETETARECEREFGCFSSHRHIWDYLEKSGERRGLQNELPVVSSFTVIPLINSLSHNAADAAER